MPIAATAALERHMKAKIMLGFLLVVLGTAFAVAKGFSGDPTPPCKPGVNCPLGAKAFSGDPIPPCKPGVNCPAVPLPAVGK